MDDEDKTEDQVVETNESEETPPIEATETPEVVEDEVEIPEEETPSDELPEEEEEPVSPRENKRIQALTKKLQEAQQRPTSQPQYQQQTITEGNYSEDELNERFRQGTDSAYEAGLSRANAIAFHTDLKIEVPRVASKYEILNEESEKFDPGVTAFINESFLKTVGYDQNTGTVQNNNISYSEYVDGLMELTETMYQGKAADSTKNLARQAAQTGVRPSGVNKQYSGADPSKMTLEQLQAAALVEAKSVRL